MYIRVYKRYNSCAHKIKRKRVLKENRIGTPPRWQVAGAISLRRRTHAHRLHDRYFFFPLYTKRSPNIPEMTILSETEIWYTQIPSEPLPCCV